MTHEYRAVVARIVDGDTLVADVDLGFGIWLHRQSFRLLGINARERSEPGGLQAAANLASLLPPGSTITLTSVKNDKYGGRYDALVRLPDGTDLSTILIETGWAAPWKGDGSKPVPPWPRTAR